MSDDYSITIKENGPYIVKGGVPLRRKTPVTTAREEPVAWKSDDVMDDGAAYALCRCGQSSNKPYCDGTHAEVGFDGTEVASPTRYADRRKSLGGEGIEIFDDRSICAHIGFCGSKVRNIWDMAEQTGDTEIRARAIAMIQHCPSGALTMEVGGEVLEPDYPTGIAVTADGPLWVTGGIPVERSDGEPIESRNRVTLCRCGQSKNKPLCDGSHWDAGFKG